MKESDVFLRWPKILGRRCEQNKNVTKIMDGKRLEMLLVWSMHSPMPRKGGQMNFANELESLLPEERHGFFWRWQYFSQPKSLSTRRVKPLVSGHIWKVTSDEFCMKIPDKYSLSCGSEHSEGFSEPEFQNLNNSCQGTYNSKDTMWVKIMRRLMPQCNFWHNVTGMDACYTIFHRSSLFPAVIIKERRWRLQSR